MCNNVRHNSTPQHNEVAANKIFLNFENFEKLINKIVFENTIKVLHVGFSKNYFRKWIYNQYSKN